MDIVTFITCHLVKSEDLNHHGTLYAGRASEWFVESGFIAAASLTRPENIVCLRIHGMTFKRPIRLGEVLRFESKIVLTGKSRLVAYVCVKTHREEDVLLSGFITFVHVDKDGHPIPHGIEVTPTSAEDLKLAREAKALIAAEKEIASSLVE